MRLPSSRARKIAIALVLASGCAFAATKHRALKRLVLPPEEVPRYQVKRAPFERRISADGYLKAVKATVLAAPADAQGALKIAWMAPDGSKVTKGDVVIRFDPSEYEKKLQDGQADRASASAKIDKEKVLADSAVRGRTRTSDLSASELQQTRAFQATDSEIFSRNQIIESGIDEQLSTARMNHAGEAKKIEGTLSKSKLDLIGVEKRSADLKVKQAEQGMKSLEVVAPHDGVIVFEQDWRGNLPHVGDSVWAGQTIASLPLLDEMEAEIFVLEADASGLQLGTPATVVLEAHPEPSYEGKIRRVDTLAKPRMREVPIQYFGASLELSRTDRAVMKPGERVHATLVLDKKDALSAPRQAVFEKDGKTIVYRWRPGGTFEPAPVKLGSASPGLVVIEEGLEEGDRIALRDPTKPADKPAGKDGDGKEPDATKSGPGGGAK